MAKIRFDKKKITIFLTLLTAIVCGIAGGTYFALTYDLPQIRSLESYRPSAVTRIYSADKILLAELFVEKRDPVPLKLIPHYLQAALIATEDRNFYTHSGVDLKGIARAVINDILAGEFVEGASTISQQLAKTLFLTPKKTLVRKIKEALLAFHLERRYTKNEILEQYFNQVYFGSGAYGVESAADIFFGKSVQDLNLAECALIAAMPKAPSRYSPLVNRPLARKRRDIVLKQMLDTGVITGPSYKNALQEPIRFPLQKNRSMKAPYFIQYVKKFLEETVGSSRLYKSGLNVFTTLSYQLQQTAEQAVAEGLTALENRMRKKRIPDPSPQGGLITLDVQSGGILAMVGGRNFHKSAFNRATAARRQPGSAFKPIVYAYAVERGFPQNKLILDAPLIYKGADNGKDWRPENFSKKFLGEMTLRKALAISQNIPAVRLLEMLGPSSVVRFAHTLGIRSTLTPNLSLALGTSEVSLMELTSAYAVFPNKGKSIKPYGVMEVTDRSNRLLWRVKPQSRISMARTNAAIITNMLENVIKEGTGRKARKLKRPVGGKTGTTNAYRDALFIGFSPSLATGVWVGRDDFSSLGKWETGARAALPIWKAFMEKAIVSRPHHYFDIPDDVVRVSINAFTGRPSENKSPDSTLALFKKGTEPRP